MFLLRIFGRHGGLFLRIRLPALQWTDTVVRKRCRRSRTMIPMALTSLALFDDYLSMNALPRADEGRVPQRPSSYFLFRGLESLVGS